MHKCTGCLTREHIDWVPQSIVLLNGVTLYLHSGPLNAAHKHHYGLLSEPPSDVAGMV